VLVNSSKSILYNQARGVVHSSLEKPKLILSQYGYKLASLLQCIQIYKYLGPTIEEYSNNGYLSSVIVIIEIVGTLKIRYLCIQALSQNKEQDVHPRAAT
jgi:hypothetical protein